MSVFKSIMQGLDEAVKYQEGKISARRTRIMIRPVESFTSDEIKQIRQKAGVSQVIFAAILGVSKKTIEAWERGRNTPSGPSCRLLQLIRDIPSMIEQY
ncbi:MAG: helix-turn-helix domain-containing protein [Sphaerochaeta sp.]|jgi:putative transcriptional regulator